MCKNTNTSSFPASSPASAGSTWQFFPCEQSHKLALLRLCICFLMWAMLAFSLIKLSGAFRPPCPPCPSPPSRPHCLLPLHCLGSSCNTFLKMGCSISSIVCFSQSSPLESNIWMPRPPSWSACLCLIDLLPSPTWTARRTRRSSPIRTTTWRTKTQSMLLHNLESQVKMPRRVDLMFSEQIVDDHGPSDNAGLRFHTAWSSINLTHSTPYIQHCQAQMFPHKWAKWDPG